MVFFYFKRGNLNKLNLVPSMFLSTSFLSLMTLVSHELDLSVFATTFHGRLRRPVEEQITDSGKLFGESAGERRRQS